MNANQEELKLLQKVVREFVRDEVVPYGYRIGEQEGAIPGRFIKQLVDMGIWGMSLPVEYGGGGMGAEASAIVAAELAYGWYGARTTRLLDIPLQSLALQRRSCAFCRVWQMPKFLGAMLLPNRMLGRTRQAWRVLRPESMVRNGA